MGGSMTIHSTGDITCGGMAVVQGEGRGIQKGIQGSQYMTAVQPLGFKSATRVAGRVFDSWGSSVPHPWVLQKSRERMNDSAAQVVVSLGGGRGGGGRVALHTQEKQGCQFWGDGAGLCFTQTVGGGRQGGLGSWTKGVYTDNGPRMFWFVDFDFCPEASLVGRRGPQMVRSQCPH